MKINMNVGLKGYYRIVVSKDAEMKEVVKDTGFFENIITNAGLHSLASFSHNANSPNVFWTDFFKEMYLGGGTATPTAEDASLENLWVTGSDLLFFYSGSASNFGDSRGVALRKQFNKGEFVGFLSEVGVGVDTPTVLFSRALVVNENGVPSPIAVTANDYLTVNYTVRQYVPFSKTFNITADIDGTPTPTEVRVQPWAEDNRGDSYRFFGFHPGRVTANQFVSNAWNDTADEFQKTLTNQVGSNVQITHTPYDATNKPFESWGKLELGENEWNGTIKTVTILGLPGSWQLRFTPEIVKKHGEKMEIEFGVRLGRYEDSQLNIDNQSEEA